MQQTVQQIWLKTNMIFTVNNLFDQHTPSILIICILLNCFNAFSLLEKLAEG